MLQLLLVLFIAGLASAATTACAQDNCYRAFGASLHATAASSFCHTYTATPTPSTTAFPTFTTACTASGVLKSRLSSVCSCLYAPVPTPFALHARSSDPSVNKAYGSLNSTFGIPYIVLDFTNATTFSINPDGTLMSTTGYIGAYQNGLNDQSIYFDPPDVVYNDGFANLTCSLTALSQLNCTANSENILLQTLYTCPTATDGPAGAEVLKIGQTLPSGCAVVTLTAAAPP